ncbi:11536_t:CDS:10, partial [Acaulospora morrowiae]
MYSQKREKPIYGSFDNREVIDKVIVNSGIQLSQKVPYNIGFPPLLRGIKKEKGTINHSGSKSLTPTNTSISTNNHSVHPSIQNQPFNDHKDLISSLSNLDRPTLPAKSEITSGSIKTDNRQSSLSLSTNSIENLPQRNDTVKGIPNLNGIDGGTKHSITHNNLKTNGLLDVHSTTIPVAITNKNLHTTNNSFPPLGDTTTSNDHTGKTQSNINRPINGQMDQKNTSTNSEASQISPSDQSCGQSPTSPLNNTDSSYDNSNNNASSVNTAVKNINTTVDGTQTQLHTKGINNNTSLNKPMTRWADLLRNNPETAVTNPTTPLKPVMKPPNSNKQEKQTAPIPNGKPVVGGLAGILTNYEPSFQRISLKPRGLVNNGNMCFMNATLSYCPPFYNLLSRISKEVAHSFKSRTPLIDSLVMFINEYKQSKTDEAEEFGEHILPDYVYDALRGLKRFDSMKGRQEDAEEFLGFLLDGLHEEFLRVYKPSRATNGQVDSHDKGMLSKDDSEDIWMEVGPRNKTSYTRTTDVEESPISLIFGGQFRSVLQCPGSNDSITRQPYQSLQLDIQPDDVKTIGDALKNLTAPENVEFKSAKKGLARATKRLFIEKLPPILTLHLKRFLYDNVGGTQKLSKHVGYSTTLSIPPELIAPGRRPSNAVDYQLFGVVYHHGKSATGGHYTADILRDENEWLHIDDTTISPISADEVT